MQQETTSTTSSGMITTKPTSPPAKILSSVVDLITPPTYSSIFFHSATSDCSTASPSNVTASPISSGGGNSGTTTTATSAISSLSRLMLEHQELLDRHALCLSQLQKTFKEAETLRQENTNLRIANRDLCNQLNLLIHAAFQSHYKSTSSSYSDTSDQYDLHALSSMADRFSCFSTGEKKRESGGWDEGFSIESPTSVMEKDRMEIQNVDVGRITMPKSISVRSNGFLKLIQAAPGQSDGSNSCLVRGATRTRDPTPASGTQKIYVRGGSREDGPIELEVYNQGMFKTELCNKWQETGTCPYGDHCQFAHGIGELRPVIRHPRYKTEVCRMVLSGDPCPYGHRCHFRHALTDQEKLMLPMRLD